MSFPLKNDRGAMRIFNAATPSIFNHHELPMRRLPSLKFFFGAKSTDHTSHAQREAVATLHCKEFTGTHLDALLVKLAPLTWEPGGDTLASTK